MDVDRKKTYTVYEKEDFFFLFQKGWLKNERSIKEVSTYPSLMLDLLEILILVLFLISLCEYLFNFLIMNQHFTHNQMIVCK